MFSRLYGNEETKAYLTTAIQTRRLAHTYLIEGQAQSGKHLLAYSIAAALAGEEMAQRVWDGTCPDVTVMGLPTDRKTISVELVRKIKESVYLMPSELTCKIYILEQVDAMTVQAQNALLKLLEEPPQQVYFFLLCENASLLLPTVRSRAQLLRTERFSSDRLQQLLFQTEEKARDLAQKDPQGWKNLITRANGSYGLAKQYLLGKADTKSQKRKERIVAIFTDLTAKTAQSALSAAARFSSAREDMAQDLERFLIACRDLMCAKQGVIAPSFFENEQEMQTFCDSFAAETVMALYDAAISAQNALSQNANLTLQQTVIALDFADAMQRSI